VGGAEMGEGCEPTGTDRGRGGRGTEGGAVGALRTRRRAPARRAPPRLPERTRFTRVVCAAWLLPVVAEAGLGTAFSDGPKRASERLPERARERKDGRVWAECVLRVGREEDAVVRLERRLRSARRWFTCAAECVGSD
jgi:hypothetical protein